MKDIFPNTKMTKAISYSLFGYDRAREKDSFEFDGYARGFFLNVRINRVLFPDWISVLNIDSASYNSPYKPIFDWLKDNTPTEINIFHNGEPLCKAMLRRLQTVFAYEHPNWRFTHTICRDTDSISTYREAQAVAQWIQEDKAIHCITDSVSHNIPMMGGMCGFRPGYVNDRLNITNKIDQAWDRLIKWGDGIDFSVKGSDQTFLMRFIYPKLSDSATEHFVLGMKETVPENNGRHYSIPDIEIDVDPVHKFLDTCAGHIGAAGCYGSVMMKWLKTMDPYRDEYDEVIKLLPNQLLL